MPGIKYKITYKKYAINLVQQKSKIKNRIAKSCNLINKLIKKDWVYKSKTKNEKKNMQYGFFNYIKVGKINIYRQIGHLIKIIKF